MVEGTPLKELKKARERGQAAARAAGIGVAPSSLQCHCLKLELMVKR
jgi:hypothetical protein